MQLLSTKPYKCALCSSKSLRDEIRYIRVLRPTLLSPPLSFSVLPFPLLSPSCSMLFSSRYPRSVPMRAGPGSFPPCLFRLLYTSFVLLAFPPCLFLLVLLSVPPRSVPMWAGPSFASLCRVPPPFFLSVSSIPVVTSLAPFFCSLSFFLFSRL